LGNNYVYEGDQVELLHPVFVQKHTPIRIEAPVQNRSKAHKSSLTSVTPEPERTASADPAPAPPDQTATEQAVPRFQFHTVRRNESLDDIARQYSTSVETLRKLNGADIVKFGMRLKIRQY
jgi:LysM repeat protein